MNEINTELFSISEQVMDSLSCGRAVVALELLEKEGILPFFEGIYCSDMVKNGKPSPDLVNMALNEIGAKHPVVIGESIEDVKMAHAAQIESIAVGWGVTSEKDIKAFAPSYYVNNWDDLSNILFNSKDGTP